MSNDGRSINRRHLLQGLGRIAAIAAVAPTALGASTAHARAEEELAPGSPGSVDMSSDRLEDVFARLQRRVSEGLIPGAVALIARRGRIVGHRAFGTRVRGHVEDEAVTLDTLFDLQSMTKVVATATAALVLVQDGVLHLDDPVVEYLPSFTGSGKSAVTVRHMLRYSAGLPLDNQFLDDPDDERVIRRMAETPLEYAPGSQVLYSDLTYRLLGRVVQAAAGVDLDTFAKARIWGPLGMSDTTYNPSPALIPRTAATGYSEVRGYVVRGEVQDEQDFALGGIAGCDGVFSTARDIATFCQMILNRGTYGGVRILDRRLSKQMVMNQTPQVTAAATDVSPIANLLSTPKGYGWELATRRFSNGGMRLSGASFGKAGGAGTFMWIDPARELFGILLTNHGLPTPFDDIGWSRMLDAIGCTEYFDGIINALTDEG